MRVFALCVVIYLVGLVSGFELSSSSFNKIYSIMIDDLLAKDREIYALNKYIDAFEPEIELRQDLTSLIVDAARAYKLDPKLLAITIKSEGNFRPNPNHKLPYVVGPGGINVKAHKLLLHNPNSYVGNIYASAEVLSKYIEDSDSLTLAITRYKGISPMGLRQAKDIVKEYKTYKEETNEN